MILGFKKKGVNNIFVISGLLKTLITLDKLSGAVSVEEKATQLFWCEASEMSLKLHLTWTALREHGGEKFKTRFTFLGELFL